MVRRVRRIRRNQTLAKVCTSIHHRLDPLGRCTSNVYLFIVFEKLFRKDKGAPVEGVALGIAGDNVRISFYVWGCAFH